jgi:hypothetical protein
MSAASASAKSDGLAAAECEGVRANESERVSGPIAPDAPDRLPVACKPVPTAHTRRATAQPKQPQPSAEAEAEAEAEAGADDTARPPANSEQRMCLRLTLLSRLCLLV